MLEVRSVSKNFGGLQALKDVSFEVKKGEIHALIGPNGAGKTTMFNVINGYIKPSSGSVLFKGRRIDGLRPSSIAQMGIARTFQITRIFSEMTVLENVITGLGKDIYPTIRVFAERIDDPERMKEAMRIVKECGLEEYSDSQAGVLPIGLQRKLEIARAIATKPDLLMLDEPASGLNDQETEELAELLIKLNSSGITILFIEHDMKFTMKIAHIITVLDYGVKIAQGSPEEIAKNSKVIEAYLGSGSNAEGQKSQSELR